MTLLGILIAISLNSVAGGLIAAPPPKPAPEIFSLVPSEGPAGQAIELKGSGLKPTRHVYFCFGRTVREAKFKAVSDDELQVTAPPFFRSGVAATVVVVTPNGATVGMPASALKVDSILPRTENAATFYQVMKDGVVTSSQGIVLVEDGGIADAPYSAGVCFVKGGGTLLKMEQLSGIVFHESKVQFRTSRDGRQLNPAIRMIQVPHVTGSPGVDPFIYRRPDGPDASAQTSPKVKSVHPDRAPMGTILTFKGSGFLETNDVSVITDRGASRDKPAGFRIDSDNLLEVDLPETTFGHPILVVTNPKGATVVLSRDHLTGNTRNGRQIETVVQVVDATSVVERGGGSRNYFIEKGGLVTETGGSCVFFVKKGGRMSLRGGGGGQTVFYETDADIGRDPQQRGGGHSIHEVESLSMSVLSSPIEVVHP